MNKITCNMYRDLITLYVDDLCSDDSKKAIEEHIEQCSECKKTYELMKDNINIPFVNEKDLEESSNFKSNLNKTWRNYKKSTTIKIVFSALILGLLILTWYLSFSKYYIFPSNMVQINNVCMMSDGSIAFEILTYNNREGSILRAVPYDDARYVEMHSKLFGNKRHSEYSSYICVDPGSFDSIYYGNPDNRILVWEEGMDIPKASEELEEYFSWAIEP